MEPVVDEVRSGLAERWLDRWPALPGVGEDLLERYAEPSRIYHDLRHLADVLSRLDELAGATQPAAVVELAAWFHDAVYDVHRADNEAGSAELAVQTLAPHLEPTAVAEVARLVRLTASHAVELDDPRGAHLCDADLAILAGDPKSYDDYAARIRIEYRHVPEAAFRSARAAILRGLLDLPTLFHTSHGLAHWEAPARANLTRELTHLLR